MLWELQYNDKPPVQSWTENTTRKPPYIGDPGLLGAIELRVYSSQGALLVCIELPPGARPIAFKRRAARFSAFGDVEDIGAENFFGYQLTEAGRNRKVILSVNPEGVVRVSEDDGRSQ